MVTLFYTVLLLLVNIMLSFRNLYPLRSSLPLRKINENFIRNTSPIVRHYWPFSKNDDDKEKDKDKDKDKEKEKDDHIEESDSAISGSNVSKKKDNGILNPFGDYSPEINPLPILPLMRRPFFPGYYSQVTIKDKATIDAIVNMNMKSPPVYLGLFLRQPPQEGRTMEQSDIIRDINEVYKTGTFAQVNNIARHDEGATLILQSHRRITLNSIQTYGPPAIGQVTHWKKPTFSNLSPGIRARMNEIMQGARELIRNNPMLSEVLRSFSTKQELDDPQILVDLVTSLVTAEGWELQKILETMDIEDRLQYMLELITKEKEVFKIQGEISRQVEEKISKQQKEYFLREQLKSIKKELGMEKDDKEDMMAKYSDLLKEVENRKLPPNFNAQSHEHVLKTIKEEMKKLESLEKNSPEFNVIRSYLDWLFAIPWGLITPDVLNIDKAKVILDEDHYGLEEIKNRILEFIAVGKLKGSVSGKIICFIGPPGVGKTSIGKSIARALDRKFFRFSVGGLTDTAEIKGHRRTYIGAMPGKPIQCLKTTKCMNPLILIDEIDKVGKSYQGDPASALLELLDPNQNFTFLDHYLDVPVDFSNVLFVCTANDESTIPAPLKDRMEIIRLTGYDTQEKIAIASRYLVPKALKEAGLVKDKRAEEKVQNEKASQSKETNDNSLKVPEKTNTDNVEPSEHMPSYVIGNEALEMLIKKYCRESGVRSLEKTIDKLARKLAFHKVKELEHPESVATTTTTDANNQNNNNGATTEGAAVPSQINNTVIEIKKEDLETYIGKPIFIDDTIYEDNETKGLPVGVVLGLAWNPFGGSPIFIETVAVPCAITERDSGVHMVTGQLGDVMKESVNIAYTFGRRFIMQRDSENKFFRSHQLHLHVPEGAVSKDGPSAGVAMATSFIRY
jgi:Lon-like ATP-dependent protease